MTNQNHHQQQLKRKLNQEIEIEIKNNKKQIINTDSQAQQQLYNLPKTLIKQILNQYIVNYAKIYYIENSHCFDRHFDFYVLSHAINHISCLCKDFYYNIVPSLQYPSFYLRSALEFKHCRLLIENRKFYFSLIDMRFYHPDINFNNLNFIILNLLNNNKDSNNNNDQLITSTTTDEDIKDITNLLVNQSYQIKSTFNLNEINSRLNYLKNILNNNNNNNFIKKIESNNINNNSKESFLNNILPNLIQQYEVQEFYFKNDSVSKDYQPFSITSDSKLIFNSLSTIKIDQSINQSTFQDILISSNNLENLELKWTRVNLFIENLINHPTITNLIVYEKSFPNNQLLNNLANYLSKNSILSSLTYSYEDDFIDESDSDCSDNSDSEDNEKDSNDDKIENIEIINNSKLKNLNILYDGKFQFNLMDSLLGKWRQQSNIQSIVCGEIINYQSFKMHSNLQSLNIKTFSLDYHTSNLREYDYLKNLKSLLFDDMDFRNSYNLNLIDYLFNNIKSLSCPCDLYDHDNLNFIFNLPTQIQHLSLENQTPTNLKSSQLIQLIDHFPSLSTFSLQFIHIDFDVPIKDFALFLSTKLKKKKFPMRKPNYSEAIDQFTQVMNSFKRDNNLMYAAFCCLSIGRCEQALKSSSSAEASCYIDSGYLIWENEIQNSEADIISFEENIPEAINCYLLAIKIYHNYKRFSIMSTLYYEMALILKKLNKLEEAAEYFQKAAEIQRTESPISSINSLKEATYCKIMEWDYKGACNFLDLIVTIATETIQPFESRICQLSITSHFDEYNNSHSNQNNLNSQNLNNNINNLNNYSSSSSSSSFKLNSSNTLPSISISLFPFLLIEARVSLFLLYILQESFSKSHVQLSKLVNDINDHDGNNGGGASLAEDTLALLNNLLVACERKEINGLPAIQRELWSSLNDMQNDILQRVWCSNKMLI
ncbi:hypothetical protein CYY_004589 [Polysphondylium violaceum]|uniref:TPR repeat-containing protein n=1 Tax=Polysphondylium violaceum TaxID=133409 RepID=A0A8J4PWN1_9MYCE|nr:hypothetical protein CYY_004589 [Polysphondylium violaceum]